MSLDIIDWLILLSGIPLLIGIAFFIWVLATMIKENKKLDRVEGAF